MSFSGGITPVWVDFTAAVSKTNEHTLFWKITLAGIRTDRVGIHWDGFDGGHLAGKMGPATPRKYP